MAEVRRRGERIRQRRRLATVVVGVLALVLPASAVATLVGGGPEPGVELTATGPGPAPVVAGDLSGQLTTTTVVVEGGAPAAPTTDGATTEAGTTQSGGAGGPSTTTTTEVHRRVASVNGSPAPPPREPNVLPAEGQAVPPAAPSGNTGSPPSGPSSPPVPPTTADPQVVACPASAVRVTVSTEKSTYAAGEAVKGSSTLENRSGTTCLLPTRAFFRVEDGAGRTVGSFAYTMELRRPVAAEPGKSFSSSFTWDQKNCSGPSCAQVAAGTYVAVADWTESGPYSGRSTFQIAP